MERQQEIVYQLDFFSVEQQAGICPSEERESVSQAQTRKAWQVAGAGQQERALTESLMQAICSIQNICQAYKQVKRNKGVAGIDHILPK